MTHTPDFPLIHGVLIARGIPCQLTSDEHGPAGITIGYGAGRTIECSWADGAYTLTFPCGMVTEFTMRTTAGARSVADEMAWQYRWRRPDDETAALTTPEGA